MSGRTRAPQSGVRHGDEIGAPASSAVAGHALETALATVEQTFPIVAERMLRDPPEQPDDIVRYFTHSLVDYIVVHSHRGSVHFALDGDGFAGQVRIVAQHLKAIGAERVLELGSGQGYNAVRLARELPSAQITGIDITPVHVRVSRLRGVRRRNVSFVRGDFHRLPFRSASLDAAYAVEALIHSHDVRKAIGEVARVLRPGGRLVLIEPPERAAPTLSSPEHTALRLLDSGWALPKHWTIVDVQSAADELGMRLLVSEDLVARVLPDVDRIARFARYWFDHPRAARAVDRLPIRFVPNIIGAYLLPHLLRAGALGYRAMMLERG